MAGILLTGGYEIPDSIRRLSEGVQQDLPIAMTNLGTYTTAERLMRVRGPITKESSRKIETARRVFAEQVDQTALATTSTRRCSAVRTRSPLARCCRGFGSQSMTCREERWFPTS